MGKGWEGKGWELATAEPKLIKREKVFAKNFSPPFIIFPWLLLGPFPPPPAGTFYFFRFSPSYKPFPLAFSEL